MLITIDTDSLDHNVYVFDSREQYDADPRSPAGYERYRNTLTGQRLPARRFDSVPEQFPCVLIEARQCDDPNGPVSVVCVMIENNALVART